MTESEIKDKIARFYEEVWNRGNYEYCDEIFATEGDRQDQGGFGKNTPALQKEVARKFREAFPDLNMVMEAIVTDGEYAASRWRMTATHKPTGKRLSDYTAVNFWRFDGDKVIDVRNNRDDLAIFEQLGLVPKRDELWKRVLEG